MLQKIRILLLLTICIATFYAKIHWNDVGIRGTKEVVYIFCHGFGANKKQSDLLIEKAHEEDGERWIIGKPYACFDFLDAKEKPGDYDRKKVSLGQILDVKALEKAYIETCEQYPRAKIVLVGISRGSAVILNFLHVCKPNKDTIGAIVLESPFDTYRSIVKTILQRFFMHWIPYAKDISIALMKNYFPLLNPDGLFPLESAKHIPLDIPILFVHAVTDTVISVNSSRMLYYILKYRGHENVYLCELSSGNHGKLVHGEDKDCYYYVAHAFYKKNQLPHNEILAEKGSNLLASMQPSCHIVKQRMGKKRKMIEEEAGIAIDDL